MQPIGVGIIGLHHLHPVDYLPHFQAIARTVVRGIAETDDAYRTRVCKQTGIQGHANIDDLLARSDIHLVAIFLPHDECPEAVEKAASAGKHILVEKPMASTSDGIRRMIAAAKKTGVTLSPPYCWRYHPASQQIKRLIDAGDIGDIIALEGRCAAGFPQRYLENGISPWLLQKKSAGGGPMHNLGVHWIDLFRWFLKDEVASATGMLSHAQHELDVEDNSFALIRFKRGATAILDISYSVPPQYPAGRDLLINIRGTRGDITWSPAWGGNSDEIFLVSNHPEYADAPVRTLQIGSLSAPGYGGISGLAYLRETVEAIANNQPPGITGTDGLRAMEVVEAIYAAAASGHTTDVRIQD